MGQRLGLAEEIDGRVQLLKHHLPYHESDHVLNLAYNALLDGQRLEDIELRRNDEAFLDGLGAQRIPDPTTSGDFTRRFDQEAIVDLMEAINSTRQRVWKKQPRGFLSHAFIDTDGTIAGTFGECKGGIWLSYKGIWGYAPLIISLANTREVLYLVNRPGNVVSHEGCVPWIDRATQVSPSACRRGYLAWGYRFHLDRGVGSLGQPRYQIYLWHGCASESSPADRSLTRRSLEAAGAFATLRNCHRAPSKSASD